MVVSQVPQEIGSDGGDEVAGGHPLRGHHVFDVGDGLSCRLSGSAVVHHDCDCDLDCGPCHQGAETLSGYGTSCGGDDRGCCRSQVGRNRKS